jgi:tetratricopeptide (TPR) repeat protein
MSFGQQPELDDLEKRWLHVYSSENYAKALKIILAGHEQNPNNSYYCTKVGATYHKLRDYLNAVLYFQRAVLLDPNNPRKYYNLGQCYFRLKQFTEAVEAYSKAIELTPPQDLDKIAELYCYRGAAYIEFAEYGKACYSHAHAIAYTLECLKRMPENTECKQLLSYYHNKRQYEVINKSFLLSSRLNLNE